MRWLPRNDMGPQTSQLSPIAARLMKSVGRNQPPPASLTESFLRQGQKAVLRCKVLAARESYDAGRRPQTANRGEFSAITLVLYEYWKYGSEL